MKFSQKKWWNVFLWGLSYISIIDKVNILILKEFSIPFFFRRDFLHTGPGGHSVLEIKNKTKIKTGILMSSHVCSLLHFLFLLETIKLCLMWAMDMEWWSWAEWSPCPVYPWTFPSWFCSRFQFPAETHAGGAGGSRWWLKHSFLQGGRWNGVPGSYLPGLKLA